MIAALTFNKLSEYTNGGDPRRLDEEAATGGVQ